MQSLISFRERVRVCITKGGTEKEKHEKARKSEKERQGREQVGQQNEGSENITAVFLATVKGGRAVQGYNDFLILFVFRSILSFYLLPHAAAVKAPSFSRRGERVWQRQEQAVQLSLCSDSSVNTITLPVTVSMLVFFVFFFEAASTATVAV